MQYFTRTSTNEHQRRIHVSHVNFIVRNLGKGGGIWPLALSRIRHGILELDDRLDILFYQNFETALDCLIHCPSLILLCDGNASEFELLQGSSSGHHLSACSPTVIAIISLSSLDGSVVEGPCPSVQRRFEISSGSPWLTTTMWARAHGSQIQRRDGWLQRWSPSKFKERRSL